MRSGKMLMQFMQRQQDQMMIAIKFRCLLVTNDEMRDHTFQLLGNDFFPKWKERHQESKRGHWHIPIASEQDYEAERVWLCITRANSSIAVQGGSIEVSNDHDEEDTSDVNKLSKKGKLAHYDNHLTPAERRYIEQREQLDVHRLAKEANKSHRDRIQDFNQYLANMSEHYDTPKVGPG